MATAREVLLEAGREARADSFNGANGFRDALADWWLAEADAHFHIGDDAGTTKFVYEMPGMEQTPAVRAARAYLDGDD